uniref:Transmembrane protein n=1 Tax=Glycine max TaxID=3847 RepID=K7KQW7_SOYBN
MESESKQVKQKLGVLDILKEAVTFYASNINFIIFTFLTSLPFFFVMVYFETLFQQTMVETPEIISLLPFKEQNYLYYHFAYHPHIYGVVDTPGKSFSEDYLPVLIQLGFIYLVPLHVLGLCSAVVTMDSASKLRSEENNISLKDMFKRSIDISIMKGTFITSLYMLFWSSCLLIAFPWTVNNCYIFFRGFGFYILFAVICYVALAKLLMVYLEWIVDGIYAIGALRVSYYLSTGNQKRGLLLMLVFFALGLCLRLSCVSLECYKGGYGIFVQIGLLTVLNTLKWVSCMIYFSDCKERKMEKKVDEESGKDLAK